jgi:uncharacterized protein (DUF169 family)
MEAEMDLNAVNDTLNRYLHVKTHPVAVKLCRSEQEIPAGVKRPVNDLKVRIPLCQGVAMARRYGWIVALGNVDQSCPFGALTMGFVKPKGDYLDGSFFDSIGAGRKEIAAKTAQAIPRLDYGKYKYAVFGPLHKASFVPDLIVVYGDAAQVARLIQGSLRKRGGVLTSSSVGGIACSAVIARTILEDECQYVVAGAGDRIFALTQDDELVFTMPLSKVEITLEGLREGHESGHHRIPTPSYLRFEPQFPSHFYKLMEFLQVKETSDDKAEPSKSK